jgi:hypothetical protein
MGTLEGFWGQSARLLGVSQCARDRSDPDCLVFGET